jgi:RNA polymerase sigma factor (TIGR02999 family)
MSQHSAESTRDLPGGAGEVTVWLRRWGYGGGEALNEILPEVYDELRRIGQRILARERSDHTLSTTALVHEAYLRLLDQRQIGASDRQEFFAIAGLTMRRVLLDYARRHRRLRRGGDLHKLPLEEVEGWLSLEQVEEVELVNDCLDRLAEMDPRAALVVQHRFFVGLTVAEIADLLGVSAKTVQRDWSAARAWLRSQVRAASGEGR